MLKCWTYLPHKFELKENSNQGKETQNPFGEASDFTVYVAMSRKFSDQFLPNPDEKSVLIKNNKAMLKIQKGKSKFMLRKKAKNNQ